MLRPDSASHRDMITDVAKGIVAQGGVPALTFSSLATRIGRSPQAIHQWVGSRARLIEVVVVTYSQRWERWTTQRAFEHAALALLPDDDEQEVDWARVLLALQEEARIRPALAPVLGEVRQHERALLGHLYPGTDGMGLYLLLSLADGLREAVCAPDGLTPSRARYLLARYCVDHAGPRAEWVDGAVADMVLAAP